MSKQASKSQQASKDADKQALTRYFHRNLISLQALTDTDPKHLMHIVYACADNLNKGFSLLDIKEPGLLEKTLNELVYDLTTPFERNYCVAKRREVLVNTNYMVFDFIKVTVDKKCNAILEAKPTGRPFIVQIALEEGGHRDKFGEPWVARVIPLPEALE